MSTCYSHSSVAEHKQWCSLVFRILQNFVNAEIKLTRLFPTLFKHFYCNITAAVPYEFYRVNSNNYIINGIILSFTLTILPRDFGVHISTHINQKIKHSASLFTSCNLERYSRLLSLNKSFILLSCCDWSRLSGKVFLTVQIKVCARLEVCNWPARHAWNSQMSMKFKEAVKVDCRSVHKVYPHWRSRGEMLHKHSLSPKLNKQLFLKLLQLRILAQYQINKQSWQ